MWEMKEWRKGAAVGTPEPETLLTRREGSKPASRLRAIPVDKHQAARGGPRGPCLVYLLFVSPPRHEGV